MIKNAVEVVLENARELHEKHPNTFERNLSGIAVGAFVKVCQLNLETPERFWVAVTAVNDEQIEGTVSNELIFSELEYGTHLIFELDNVYQVYTGKPGTGGETDNVRNIHKECN